MRGVPENGERGPKADKAAGATKARRGMVRLKRDSGRAKRRAFCMRGLKAEGSCGGVGGWGRLVDDEGEMVRCANAVR